MRWLLLLVLALCVAPHKGANIAPGLKRKQSVDSLAKSLASLFLVKEGNVPAAKHFMGIFQAVADAHVLQNGGSIKAQQAQQLQQYAQQQITQPTEAYLRETLQQHLQGLKPNLSEIANAMQPNLEYFVDPNQNFISDFFGALTQAGTSIGSVSGPDFIDSAPCLISTAAQGVAVQAAAIDIIPQLISISPAGVGIFPQAINIQPAGIYISPYGDNISPIGVNIQPVLISITPVADSITPIGVSVAPSLISQGGDRRLLAEKITQGKETSGQKEPSYSEAFLQSYEKWIQVAADLVLRREATPQAASAFLSEVFTQTGHQLNAFQSLCTLAEGIASGQGAFNATQDWEEVAEEYSQLYPVEVTQALLNGSFHDPDFDVSSLLPSGVSFTDPEFFNDMGSNVSSTLQGFSVASSFIEYAPCLVANTPIGIAIAPSAITIQPNGIIIAPQGVNVQPQGINIQPTLIYVAPAGSSVTPTGVAIGPTLINISPVLHEVGDTAVNIGDDLVSISNTGQVTIGGSGSGGSGSGGSGGGSTSTGGATVAASGKVPVGPQQPLYARPQPSYEGGGVFIRQEELVS